MVLKKEGSSAKAKTESKPPKKSLELLSVDENSEETKDAIAVPEKPVVKTSHSEPHNDGPTETRVTQEERAELVALTSSTNPTSAVTPTP